MRLCANSIGLQATNLGSLNVGRRHLVFYLLFMKLLDVKLFLVHFAVWMFMECRDNRV